MYTHIHTHTFLALNKAYKSCLGASEGTLPLHPWQSVLMHLQIITLPPFTLPACSDTIPDSTRTSFQGKGERIHAQISCITFRKGVICEEFLSCCKTECPKVDDCSSDISKFPPWKVGIMLKMSHWLEAVMGTYSWYTYIKIHVLFFQVPLPSLCSLSITRFRVSCTISRSFFQSIYLN